MVRMLEELTQKLLHIFFLENCQKLDPLGDNYNIHYMSFL